MKTELSKQFKWGFILGEREIRRLIQLCIENAEKIDSDNYSLSIKAQLQDGSIIETHNIDDILALENVGAKSVQKLKIDIKSLEKSWGIMVCFQNGYKNKKSWTSAEYEIFAESRDWVFVCSSEIEERIKRCRTLSFDYITSHRWFLIVPLFLGMLLSISTTKYFGPNRNIADKLQAAYDTGEIKNAIEAIIFVEKAKNSFSIIHDILPITIAMVSPLLVFYLIGTILPKIYPSYNFYWGDYISEFDKKKNVIKIIWTVVILGILASVIAGIILRYI